MVRRAAGASEARRDAKISRRTCDKNSILQKIEIISSKSCPFAQRSRMVLLEKGIDFVFTEIDLELHRRRLTEAVLFMEQQGLRKLSSGPFWLGAKPSLVDFTFFPHVQRFAALEHYRGFVIPEECERLRAWIAAMSALPSVQATRRTTAQLIEAWKKYADNSGKGVTAQEMREA